MMSAQTSITVKAPGKLMIAGEYAVLEAHHVLAVMAVDRFVYATIEDSEKQALTLTDLGLQELSWSYQKGQVHIYRDDSRVQFVQQAMSVVCRYLEEQSHDWESFTLSIRSELDDVSGRKYGLGSSAAVTVAVVSAILEYVLPEKPKAELVFKLAATAHVLVQGSGSGADVAASAYGGVLRYVSFQADWLLAAWEENTSITALVHGDWPYLQLTPVTIPDSIAVRIGWTGKPASTTNLVGQIQQMKRDKPARFAAFIKQSDLAVAHIFEGIQAADWELIFQGVKQNRMALATLGEDADVPLETPLLATLCDAAEQLGGAGKQSGAGGGDCGIAFMPSVETAKQLTNVWLEAGIQPLDLQIYHRK